MKRITIPKFLAALMIASLPPAAPAQESSPAEPTATTAAEAASSVEPTSAKPTTDKKPKTKPAAAATTGPASPEKPTSAKPAAAESTAVVTLDANSLAEIEHATKAMNDCAAIADEIAAQEVPERFVAFRKRKATREHKENRRDPADAKRAEERAKRAAARASEEAAIAKGPKNPKGSNVPAAAEGASPVAIPPEEDDSTDNDQDSKTFIDKMETLSKRLDTSGEEFERALKTSETAIKNVGKTKLSKEDAATFGAAMDKYQAAREKIGASFGALSNNRQIQAYVHPIVKKHFLKL